MILKEMKEILKEKDTWILGTGIFIGFVIGSMISPFISFEPNVLTRILLIIALYGVSLALVVLIKWNDRLRFL